MVACVDSVGFVLGLRSIVHRQPLTVLGQVDQQLRVGVPRLVARLLGNQFQLVLLHHFPLLLHALLFSRVHLVLQSPRRGLVEGSQVVAVREGQRCLVQLFLHVDRRLAREVVDGLCKVLVLELDLQVVS